MDEYLNVVEAARFLGVSRTTLYRLIREGKLPTYQSELNRAVRLVRRSDLDRLRQPRPASITTDATTARRNREAGAHS